LSAPLLNDKPWFLKSGKNLAAILIIPSSWGSQLDGEKITPLQASDIFCPTSLFAAGPQGNLLVIKVLLLIKYRSKTLTLGEHM
jgi:hypothetical protein